ncbi:MAG: protein kinase [Planctomycetes bacterium]|nr:protein kinase [Planctomycetota bacterium]
MPDFPRLVILSGPLAREAICLDGPAPVVLGARAGYALPDPELDAVHCLVFAVDGAWFVQDLGGEGGTWVGDQRLLGARQLEDGDTVRVASTWLGFLATPESEPKRAPGSEAEAAPAPPPAPHVPPPRLAAGDTCGDYAIEAVVAETEHGQLLRGRDTKRGRTVALKVLDPDAAQDRQRVARFLRGAKLGGRLKHPTIARVLGAGHADGHVYVLREWIEGVSLEEACKQAGGRLEPRAAVALALQLSDGLVHLHEHEVVHSHVSPRDVLITEHGAPKLLGLGLAKRAPQAASGKKPLEVTDESEVLIPSPFVAPEAAVDRGNLDPRADVYGLGATLAYALCGQAPFPATPTREALLAGSALAPRALIPELSEALDALLTRCLAADPAQRFESAAALRSALAALPEAPVPQEEVR